MEDARFDRLIRAVTERDTRRNALGLLLGGSASLLGITAGSRKKKKRRKSKKKRKGCRGGCPAGAICSGKVCVFCASGQLACGNACVAANDRANCGACGNACPSGAVCQSGACVFCAIDRTQCGNACVNLATDPANCGRCGKTCPSGTCSNGACMCVTGNSAHCPAGCECLDSDFGVHYCSVQASTGNTCSSNSSCPLGQVCEAGLQRYCHGACLG